MIVEMKEVYIASFFIEDALRASTAAPFPSGLFRGTLQKKNLEENFRNLQKFRAEVVHEPFEK